MQIYALCSIYLHLFLYKIEQSARAWYYICVCEAFVG